MGHEDVATPGAEIKKDGVFARAAAIALRIHALHAAYPHALVSGDVMVQREVHLVCWQCRPGQAWVWAFMFARTFRRRPADAERLLEPFRRRVEQDPLSAGLEVVAGPRFQSLGLPVSQTGSNNADLHELVVVTDADQDGLRGQPRFHYQPGLYRRRGRRRQRRTRSGGRGAKPVAAAALCG